jgi:uncharacterized protein
LGINMVFAPPFKEEKLDMIQRFFDNLEWLPEEVQIRMTYPVAGSIPYNEQDFDYEEKHGSDGIITTIGDWTLKRSLSNDKEVFSDFAFISPLNSIHTRPVYQYSTKYIPLNGTCIPAQRKVYVNIDGKIIVCEKMSSDCTLGDVFNGVDFEILEKAYIKEYKETSFPLCSKCWAARMCGICYANCYTGGKIDVDKKNVRCEIAKKYIHQYLSVYSQLIENNSSKINLLDELKIV